MATTPAQSPSVLSSLPARYPLISYFLLAFGFSWLMFLPGPLMYYGVISLSDDAVRSLAIGGLLGPILSGFIMTAVTEGRPGIACLLRRMVCWRVGIRWYVFALVGLPVTMVLATFIRPGASESLDISAERFFLDYLRAFISMVLIRRTALRGTRLDRLRAASLTAIMWSFDRRPNPRQSLGSVAFAWIFNPLPGRDGYTSERYSPRLHRVRPSPSGSAPNHHLGRQ